MEVRSILLSFQIVANYSPKLVMRTGLTLNNSIRQQMNPSVPAVQTASFVVLMAN